MNINPSYKIVTPLVSIYVLCLFLPTIDLHATLTINLFFLSISFPIPSLIFPAIYPISDSITEVYGKKIACFIVVSSYIVIILFSFVNNTLLYFSHEKDLYEFILKKSILLTIIGPVAYFFTSLVNIFFINRLKLYMRGKHFVLRSLICSALSETIISFIVLSFVFYEKNILSLIQIISSTIIIKLIVTIPYVFIAKFLVIIYRRVDGIERSLYNKNFVINSYNEAINE